MAQESTGFDLIERPSSSNKRPRSCPGSSESVITLWILFEGNRESDKYDVEEEFFDDKNYVYDLKIRLQEKFTVLKNVQEVGKIEIYAISGSGQRHFLPAKIALKDLKDKNETDLLVRYPLSNANIKVTYKYGRHEPDECEIPHSSGSLNLLKEAVMENYKDLRTRNFYFVYDDGKVERRIQNEYNFNILVSERELDGNKLGLLKVIEKDKKSFSAWNIKDAFSEILHKNYDSLEDMPRLDMKTLPPLEREFSEKELEHFVWELLKNLDAFNKAVSTNEMTSRVYINSFMTTAVRHVKVFTNKPLRLSVEIELDGTYGYGPLDYAVKLIEILVLLVEAKSEDMKQGAAQAFAQAYTTMEKLLCKFNEPIMYGIVSNGKLWRFFRWAGPLDEPEVYITEEFTCILSDDSDGMKDEKKILKYIAQILQAQVKMYDDENREHHIKRHCTSKGRNSKDK